MLARWLRLFLLFEFGSYAILSGLHQWLGLSVAAVFVCMALLAASLRLLPVVFSFLHATLYQRLYPATNQAAYRFSWTSLRSEACMALALSWQQAFPKKQITCASSHKTAILLVHGYGCNSGFWWWLLPRLQAAGHPVDAVSLEPLFGDIDGYAEQISRAVNCLQALTGQPVLLVGHSMGGLACLAYLRRYGEDHIGKLITLGSPLRGTETAQLLPGGLSRNVDQMRCGSPWLKELWQFFDEWPLQIPLVCFYSQEDPMILPVDCATLAEAESRRLTDHGHLHMGYSDKVLRALLQEAQVLTAGMEELQ